MRGRARLLRLRYNWPVASPINTTAKGGETALWAGREGSVGNHEFGGGGEALEKKSHRRRLHYGGMIFLGESLLCSLLWKSRGAVREEISELSSKKRGEPPTLDVRGYGEHSGPRFPPRRAKKTGVHPRTLLAKRSSSEYQALWEKTHLQWRGGQVGVIHLEKNRHGAQGFQIGGSNQGNISPKGDETRGGFVIRGPTNETAPKGFGP